MSNLFEHFQNVIGFNLLFRMILNRGETTDGHGLMLHSDQKHRLISTFDWV